PSACKNDGVSDNDYTDHNLPSNISTYARLRVVEMLILPAAPSKSRGISDMYLGLLPTVPQLRPNHDRAVTLSKQRARPSNRRRPPARLAPGQRHASKTPSRSIRHHPSAALSGI